MVGQWSTGGRSGRLSISTLIYWMVEKNLQPPIKSIETNRQPCTTTLHCIEIDRQPCTTTMRRSGIFFVKSWRFAVRFAIWSLFTPSESAESAISMDLWIPVQEISQLLLGLLGSASSQIVSVVLWLTTARPRGCGWCTLQKNWVDRLDDTMCTFNSSLSWSVSQVMGGTVSHHLLSDFPWNQLGDPRKPPNFLRFFGKIRQEKTIFSWCFGMWTWRPCMEKWSIFCHGKAPRLCKMSRKQRWNFSG